MTVSEASGRKAAAGATWSPVGATVRGPSRRPSPQAQAAGPPGSSGSATLRTKAPATAPSVTRRESGAATFLAEAEITGMRMMRSFRALAVLTVGEVKATGSQAPPGLAGLALRAFIRTDVHPRRGLQVSSKIFPRGPRGSS
ncbi:hypothetical protein GCM10009665_38930 [Kitasatospora nipponensis]|uniref:Uncharacterized protein n=1 Tax=Kitasatospora nipponensis TaxID=258049 RepID=A0ABP4GYX0_9ACTN